MLSAMNLQFTRASNLNDEYEFDIRKCDFSTVIKSLVNYGIEEPIVKEKIEHANSFFKSIGVCSFGTKPDNLVLWKKYASSSSDTIDGLCIEVDQHTVINNLLSRGIKTCALLVHHVENVEKFLPWGLYLGNPYEKTVFCNYCTAQRMQPSGKMKKKLDLFIRNLLTAHITDLLSQTNVSKLFTSERI